MQYKFFTIPATHPGDAEEELNRFLRGNRVVAVQKELVRHDGASLWSLCVEYLEGRGASGKTGAPRVDYRELLSTEDFAVFTRLRDKRKELANAEAVPVYAICTNQQLAEMAKRRVASVADFKKIEGLGDVKGDKYGPAFVEVLAAVPGSAPSEGGTDEAGGDAD